MDITKKCSSCGGLLNFKGITPWSSVQCSCGTLIISPDSIGHFRLDEALGKMHDFEMFYGYNMETNHECEIYILDKKTEAYYKQIERLKKECTSIEHLNNSSVIQSSCHMIKGKFLIESLTYPGFNLAQYDPDVHNLYSITEVLNTIQGVAAGLSLIHKNSLTHHNLSESNILVCDNGTIKIKNLLLSRYIYSKVVGNVDEILKTISPYYINPELLTIGREMRSGDMFGLGVLFYFLLTGRYPYDGEDKNEILQSRIQDSKYFKPVVPPNELRDEIPNIISNMVLKLLDLDPKKRIQASRVIDDFDSYKTKSVQQETLGKAQEDMINTKTVSFPKISGFKLKTEQKKKKKKSFKLFRF